MEIYDEERFDTDLEDDDDDDDDDDSDETKAFTLPRLSLTKKLAIHRSNRLDATFGQSSVPSQFYKETKKDNDGLLPIRCKTPTKYVERIRIYENSCQMLDTTIDWQLRSFLLYDTVNVVNRSFSFNDIRAFATAMEANLESLTLSSVGLTARSINVLCEGLKKCVHLHSLDLSCNKLRKESLEQVVNIINNLPLIVNLSFANCGLRDSYNRIIGDLCRHKRLTDINLSGNELEEVTCIFIGGALTENVRLIQLNLSWNAIRNHASIALFRGFEINRTLTDFDISWSDLGYDGSVALRRVLIVNRFLQNINVSSCNIDAESAKLIGQGLEKNSTLQKLNLSYNPLTTHGVHHLVQALSTKKSLVSMLDLTGITVSTATARLAESIANRRNFVIKYDFEIPFHNSMARKKITKVETMRKIIEHMDERHWRPLDYYRILTNKMNTKVHHEASYKTFKSDGEGETISVDQLQRQLTNQLVQPFTFKNLNDEISQQRVRDRLLKARQEKQQREIQDRNKKILQTVNEYFPNIDIISKQEKHKDTIEQLAKPRSLSTKSIP